MLKNAVLYSTENENLLPIPNYMDESSWIFKK
jgi:hypothetical protein